MEDSLLPFLKQMLNTTYSGHTKKHKDDPIRVKYNITLGMFGNDAKRLKITVPTTKYFACMVLISSLSHIYINAEEYNDGIKNNFISYSFKPYSISIV